MATLETIRQAIKTTLETIDGLTVHAYVKGQLTGHALTIEPDDGNFEVAMARGTDTVTFALWIYTPAADLETGQRSLDEYLSSHGPRSLRQVIFLNRTLGLADTTAHVAGWDSYGSKPSGESQHIGARVRLIAHTRGTP